MSKFGPTHPAAAAHLRHLSANGDPTASGHMVPENSFLQLPNAPRLRCVSDVGQANIVIRGMRQPLTMWPALGRGSGKAPCESARGSQGQAGSGSDVGRRSRVLLRGATVHHAIERRERFVAAYRQCYPASAFRVDTVTYADYPGVGN